MPSATGGVSHFLPRRRAMPEPQARPGSRRDQDASRRHIHRRRDGPDEEHARNASRSPERKRRRTAEERRTVSPDTETRESSRRHRPTHRREKTKSRVAGASSTDVLLPYSARPLAKSDLQVFEPLFVYYLSLQKQKNVGDMDEREFKGRWRSFVGRWNRKELAEGWYDPEMMARISTEASEADWTASREASQRFDDTLDPTNDQRDDNDDDDDGDNDSGYGPPLPQPNPRRQVGAKIPSLQDLSLRNELVEEAREADRDALRAARKADRAQQKERLEELVPRAEAGTRERKLEKRRETGEKMRQFREKSPGLQASDEKDLMGGGDSLEEYKKTKDREKRKKSERQVRREEMERAKHEEMEQKRRAWQEREEGTVSMLRELARQRFG